MTGARRVVLFALLLVPSAWFAFRNREMPQLGHAHDDAIYYTVGKSLAAGEGYRIASLPQTPYETKYPPGLIVLLALVWQAAPDFPGNLVLATAIQWLMIPVFLCLCWSWFRWAGLSENASLAAVALLALSPYTVLFGAGIYTEVLFSIFLLLSLFCTGRENGISWPLVAGLCAALGYLTRSAGQVIVISTPAVLLIRGRWRAALAFVAAMAPALLLWTAWAQSHRPASNDLVSIYNTDYLGFWRVDIQPRDLGIVIWKNLGFLFSGVGSLAFPVEDPSPAVSAIRAGFGVLIIRGLVREARNARMHAYLAFALLSTLGAVIWDFPPNLRLMYPLAPLFALALVREGQRIIDLLAKSKEDPDRSQRAAAYVLSGVLAAVTVAIFGTAVYSTAFALPKVIQESEQERADNRAAFEWIAQHSSPNATIMSFNPTVYLSTGRRTESLLTLPVYWYRGDTSGMLRPFHDLPQYASQRKLDFLYLHDADYDRLAPGVGEEAKRTVETDPELKSVFRAGRGAVYEVKR